MFLIDKSAWVIAQRNDAADRAIIREVAENNVAVNSVITLELLVSARNVVEHRRERKWLQSLNELGLGPATQQRAIELQGRLAATGRHRIPVTDLLIAACAEQHAADLLHYDRHFDLIAEVSELKAHWIVPRAAGH